MTASEDRPKVYGRQGDLLRDVAGGDQLLRGGHVVVLHHGDAQMPPGRRVCVDHIGQAQYGVDDVLGDGIGRGCLRAEDHRHRALREDARADVQQRAHAPQQVQLLALVLVEALRLHIEHAVRVDDGTLVPPQPIGEAPLVGPLDLGEGGEQRRIVDVREQLLQLSAVPAPARADGVVDPGRQGGIAAHQPAAEGDAVGLVVELLRIDGVSGCPGSPCERSPVRR